MAQESGQAAKCEDQGQYRQSRSTNRLRQGNHSGNHPARESQQCGDAKAGRGRRKGSRPNHGVGELTARVKGEGRSEPPDRVESCERGERPAGEYPSDRHGLYGSELVGAKRSSFNGFVGWTKFPNASLEIEIMTANDAAFIAFSRFLTIESHGDRRSPKSFDKQRSGG